MLKKFSKLFAPDSGPAQDPRERVRLATCVILLEVANVDLEFSEVERDHLVETIRARFDLSSSDAHELMATAQAARDKSVDLWQFTHSLNEHCSIAEKIDVIEEVWRVICADGMLDAYEDHLVRRLSFLLNLTHAQLIDAKLKALDEFRNS